MSKSRRPKSVAPVSAWLFTPGHLNTHERGWDMAALSIPTNQVLTEDEPYAIHTAA